MEFDPHIAIGVLAVAVAVAAAFWVANDLSRLTHLLHRILAALETRSRLLGK